MPLDVVREDIETRIAPDLLDTIGRSFKFRHGKGAAEWLKNALDSYLRLRVAGVERLPGKWPVLLCLSDGTKGIPGPNLAVVDFGGTEFQKVQDFLLYWGDTTAAAQGSAAARSLVTGGHGNGGKFYMREMWRNGARFLTWRENRLTSLVVDKAKRSRTGYWELRDVEVDDWHVALKQALPEDEGFGDSARLLEVVQSELPAIAHDLSAGRRGLTVVAGRRAVQVASSNDVVRGKRWDMQRLLEDLRTSPQARRPLRELTIAVIVNGDMWTPQLEPFRVEEDEAWPPKQYPLPGSVVGISAEVAGELTLRKSSTQLVGKLREHNVLSVLDGSDNPVATYPLQELAVPNSPLLRFFFGELALRFEGLADLVANDRDRLIQSPASAAILSFAADRLREEIQVLEQAEREARRTAHLEAAAILNDSLNEHARRFLEKLQTEITVNYILDPAGGGPGQGGSGTGHGEGERGDHEGKGRGGAEGSGGAIESEGTRHRAHRPRFPAVLLSGYDENPATPGSTKELSKMHPPLYQDDQDRECNVWWVNSRHPFATAALERGGAKGPAFRSHQLFMFRDVVQREVLRLVQRREAEIPLDRLETELDEISNRFLAELPVGLVDELMGPA